MTTEVAPFAIGDRVRLAKPDNAAHPRAGRVGTVIRARYYPETIGRFRLLTPAVTMCLVRFDPPIRPDEFDRKGCGAEWLLFDYELVREEGERT